jgi:hypothetical protein
MTDLFQVAAVSSSSMPPERVSTEIKLHQKSRVMEIAFADR